MIYLICGEISLALKKTNEILEEYKNLSIIKYDLEENYISKVIEDINTIDLFGNKKAIIVFNFNKIEDFTDLIKYINNRNDNILILTSPVTLKNKVAKEILKFGKIIDVNNINLNDYITNNFQEYKISFMAINLLKDYCGNNICRIDQEINKLKLLKLEEKKITEEDIKSIVKKGIDKNIFDLINAINEKNKKDIFNIYYQLLHDVDEIQIIGFLANNFRLLYQIKVLKEENSDEDIIKQLKLNPYRFKILKRETINHTEEELLKYLKDLGDLDIGIKSGNIDKAIGMELYLSKL